MKNYFAVMDKVSGKEILYQVIQGSSDDGFDIVAAGKDIGALADDLMEHVETTGCNGFDIHITPPDRSYWLDVKQGSESKSELDDSDFVTHEMKKMSRTKLKSFIAKMHDETKYTDCVFMFYG